LKEYLWLALGGIIGNLALAQSQVPVPQNLKGCVKAEDCELVDYACEHCCQHDAVAKKHAQAYRKLRDGVCAGYRGGACDCMEHPQHLECVNSQCSIVLDNPGVAPTKR
jgi:hypothetical protein